MNLEDLELPKVKMSPVASEVTENNLVEDELEINGEVHSNFMNNGWKKILALSVVLAFLIGVFCGALSGFLIARKLYNTKDPSEQLNDEYSKYDYSQFIINEAKGITIADLYADNEERYWAMQFIGMKMPELKYVNSKSEVLSTSVYKDGSYILEIVQPNCNYCKGMVPLMNEYRNMENSLPLIGLSIRDGDLSVFNEAGETTFVMMQKDATTKEFWDMIQWVPMFVYVKNGEIKYVSFGNLNGMEELQKQLDIAFN